MACEPVSQLLGSLCSTLCWSVHPCCTQMEVPPSGGSNLDAGQFLERVSGARQEHFSGGPLFVGWAGYWVAGTGREEVPAQS